MVKEPKYRELISNELNIKLKFKIKPGDYILTIGRYSNKTLNYIFKDIDNLNHLLKLLNLPINQEIKDNIIIFLKQMRENSIYFEYINNSLIEENLINLF